MRDDHRRPRGEPADGEGFRKEDEARLAARPHFHQDLTHAGALVGARTARITRAVSTIARNELASPA